MTEPSKIPKFVFLFILCLLAIGITDVSASERPDSTNRLFRIVQISDTQPVPGDETHYQRVTKSIELINPLKPDIVIFPGDITSSGTEDEYKQIKKLLSTIEAPIHYVPGNHDTLQPADEAEKALSPKKLREKKLKLYQHLKT